MTIALKIGTTDSEVQGIVYLDAVTSYSRSLKGKVTSHPVDSGSNISDHFVANNPSFSIRGIVSHVDITGTSALVEINGGSPVNSKAIPASVTIAEQDNVMKYLPGSVKQFFSRGEVEVSGAVESQNTQPQVLELFNQLMTGVYYNQAAKRWQNRMTLTVLYEMDGPNFVNAITDLVITSVDVNEDSETGSALHVDISLEKVRFATLEKVPIKNLKIAQKTQNKGKVTPETGNSDDADNKKANAPKGADNFRAKIALKNSGISPRLGN